MALDARQPFLAGPDAERHLDPLVEGVEHADQPIEGKAAIGGVAHAREIGGGKAGRPGRLPGRQLPLVERPDDPGSDDALGVADVGVGITKIRQTLPLPRTSSMSSFTATSPSIV